MNCPAVLSKGISSGTGRASATGVGPSTFMFLGAYMPRKAKRQADGTKTPWYSPKAEAAHDVAARAVRAVGVVVTDAGRTFVDTDALVGVYFTESGYTLRITPCADQSAWYKCGIPGKDGRKYYLLVQKQPQDLHTTALVNLCERIEEMWRGSLKPSPDTWKG